ncbi:uncharacterized protein LOC134563241 [Prinia subflava]|uniref:uncharacterized protein LOC134563241 n=1 Tax=Prinia subflava TaxID=208062 RepID=UPI002FE21A86
MEEPGKSQGSGQRELPGSDRFLWPRPVIPVTEFIPEFPGYKSGSSGELRTRRLLPSSLLPQDAPGSSRMSQQQKQPQQIPAQCKQKIQAQQSQAQQSQARQSQAQQSQAQQSQAQQSQAQQSQACKGQTKEAVKSLPQQQCSKQK